MRYGLLAMVFLVAGCEVAQPVGGGPAVVTAYVPTQVPQVVSPVPPPPPPVAPPLDGSYAGRAFVTYNPMGGCRDFSLGKFVVKDGHVRFGSFRGTIGPDGGLLMTQGSATIDGRFDGGHFDGRMTRPPPKCAYRLALDRH